MRIGCGPKAIALAECVPSRGAPPNERGDGGAIIISLRNDWGRGHRRGREAHQPSRKHSGLIPHDSGRRTSGETPSIHLDMPLTPAIVCRGHGQ